jgi:hypothetical protein
MNNTFLNTLLVGQLFGPPENRAVADKYETKIALETPGTTARSVAALRRVEFERRFQALVEAMNAFAEKYNGSKGELLPYKEARTVRSALRDLQNFEPLFQDPRKRD